MPCFYLGTWRSLARHPLKFPFHRKWFDKATVQATNSLWSGTWQQSHYYHKSKSHQSSTMTAGNMIQQPPYSPSAVAPVPLWSYPNTTLKDCHVRLYSTRPPTPPAKIIDENGNEMKISKETSKTDDVEAALLPEEKKEEKLSIVKRFKLMYKQYWYVLIPVHIVTSCVWYGSFFIAAKSGVDIVPLLEKIGASEKILDYLRNNNAGYYAIAYAMYKVASPARYFVTVGGTTISINYLKKYGYIKPVPSKERMQEIYEGKKEEIKDKYEDKRDVIIDKYQDKKWELQDRYEDRKCAMRDKKDELIIKYHYKTGKLDEEDMGGWEEILKDREEMRKQKVLEKEEFRDMIREQRLDIREQRIEEREERLKKWEGDKDKNS